MTEHHTTTTIESFKALVSWLAALLGIGTVAGLVNLGVGLLSGCWLAYQLWVAIVFELPIKRARLQKAMNGSIEPTEPGDLQ